MSLFKQPDHHIFEMMPTKEGEVPRTIPSSPDPLIGVILKRFQGPASLIIRQEQGLNNHDLVISVEATDPKTRVTQSRQVYIPANVTNYRVAVPELNTNFTVTRNRLKRG